MLVKHRKNAVAACEAKAVGGGKERSITCAEAKTARTVSKVDKPCPKRVEAINDTVIRTPQRCITAPKVSIFHWFQPHKKFKEIPGLSSPVQPPAVLERLKHFFVEFKICVRSLCQNLLFSEV